MLTRRAFLRTGTAAGATLASFAPEGLGRIAHAAAAVNGVAPETVARDEDFWREVQLAFTLDRSIVNLNNGGVCPSPRVVHEAFKRYLDISNQAPVYFMWRVLEPGIEAVRRSLARTCGCDAEELAITRNASEALQIAQLGLDLAWRRGRHEQSGLRRGCSTPGISGRAGTADDHEDLVPRTAAVTGCHRREVRAHDHAAHEGAPLLPHHQPDRPDPAGPRHVPDGALSAASRPSSTAPTRSRTSRSRSAISGATTTAAACTSGCWRRWAPDCSTSAVRW